MGSVRATMNDHTIYHHAPQQHHLSKVFNQYAIDEHLQLSKDGEMGRRWAPVITDQNISTSDGHPIDLSNKKSNKIIGYVCDGDVTDEDIECKNGNMLNGHVGDNILDNNENDNDEPLNLSTTNKTNSPKLKTPLVSKGNSPELLQKKVRLEEMVSYIRKCSIVDEPKFGLNGASDADSEGDDDQPLKLSAGAAEDGHVHHRRKRRVTYRGGNGNVLRLSYRNGNGDALHQIQQQQRSYPVLRQQLLKSVNRNGDNNDELDESDDHSNVEDDEEGGSHRGLSLENESGLVGGPIVSSVAPASHLFAYYANLLQGLSHPTAAQGLLMTTNASNSDEILSKSNIDSVQQQQLQSNDSGTIANANGATANGLLRKRAPRALTGKHVKHGTGASPSTLLTLRQKLEQKMSKQLTKSGNGNFQENGSKDGRRVAVSKRATKRKA